MNLKFEQIRDIVIKNPGKDKITKGRQYNEKMLLHVHGDGLEGSIKQSNDFATNELYRAQKEGAISNKDMISRLLQPEDMIFSARGGSSYFNMSEAQEREMNALLSDIKDGMSLRKWVRNVAIIAYRCDPYGVILMEVKPAEVDASGAFSEQKVYPTYKSISKIYDYASSGRNLEWIAFRLDVKTAISFGIQDDKFDKMSATADSNYFRIIDDAKDLIVKQVGSEVSVVSNIIQPNPIANQWGRVPGFIISDLFKFNDINSHLSPLDTVVELADMFLYDRSVRNLQKKFHGFAKAVEPMLMCPDCNGEGYQDGEKCKSCDGSKYKKKTKVNDVARFPVEILEKLPGFDFSKIFGYVAPPIDIWEKQDMSLADLESLARATYYGISLETKTSGPATGQANNETATKTDQNWRPVEARLNMTADWCEDCENRVANFVGQYIFGESFRGSSISYGRNYILRTVKDYLDEYMSMRSKGVPDFELDAAMERYIMALHQNNPVALTIAKKKLYVEPFPHMTIPQVQSLGLPNEEFLRKLYYGEWQDTVSEAEWLTRTEQQLKDALTQYISGKTLQELSAQN